MEESQQESGDEKPGFTKSGPASSVQQRRYRRHSPSPSTSRSPSSYSPPETGGKRHRTLSPRTGYGDAKAIDDIKKGRRLEAQDEVEKSEAISLKRVDNRKFEGSSQSRHHAENYDPGHSSYTGASGRRYGDSRREDSRHEKDKNSEVGNDPWSSERDYKDYGRDRTRVRSYERDAEGDTDGKGRGSREWERTRDKERDRDKDRESYRGKDSDADRRESARGGRDYFGSNNDVRKSRDNDREKSRAYRSGYNDIDERNDRDRRNNRYDYRGRDHYQDKDLKKYVERDRVSGKDDQRHKKYSHEKTDYAEEEWSREKEDVHERDAHKGSHERSAPDEHRSSNRRYYSPGRSKAARILNKDEDDKHRSQTDEICDTKSRSSEKRDVATKLRVLKSGDGCHKDYHSDSKQDSPKVSIGDAKSSKSSKWGPEAQTASENVSTSPSAQEVANDVSNAKLAAMKAAELVNKNLGVAGFMSADQKKKLLWGAKKKIVEEEPAVAAGANRWENVHFSDRERLEKFNKLMGVKADAKGDGSVEERKDAGIFTEEKQRELQQDLEKQYTAGLRRRDGRTVGLGL